MKKTNKKLLLIIISLSTLLNVSMAAERAGTFTVSNSNFKDLYNNQRTGTPEKDHVPWAGTYWPYGKDGINWIGKAQDYAPSTQYDIFYGLGTKTFDWEEKNHSCRNQSDEYKDGCNSWWGHCNAWSAAAIKETEPRSISPLIRSPKTGKELTFTVGDKKAYLTELWMNSSSLFVGDTYKGQKTGSWIFDPDSPKANKFTRSGNTAFDAFWDVSPRTFFLVLTNYLGIRKTGIVIDRFTGDQVWNQPLVGYRILTIRPEDTQYPAKEVNGRTVYPVLMRVKIYWAEDGVFPNDISDPFDLDLVKDDENDYYASHHFSGRLIKFFLHLDQKLDLSDDANNPRIVGRGEWHHRYADACNANTNACNKTHPDFLWLPTKVYPGGNANPYIQKNAVRFITNAKAVNLTPKVNSNDDKGEQNDQRPLVAPPVTTVTENFKKITIAKIKESYPYLSHLSERFSKRLLRRSLMASFSRGSQTVSINYKEIKFNKSKDTATIPVTFTQTIKDDQIKTILADSGIQVATVVTPE